MGQQVQVGIKKLYMPCDCVYEQGMQGKKRLGILGGTFDPVHMGHIDIALHARNCFALHRTALMPAGIPAHKPNALLAPARQRLEMVRLAVEGTPLEAWDIEVKRAGDTYTVDTLEILQSALGAEYDLYYIIGADTLMEIPAWKDPVRVFGLCTFLVFYRPGETVEAVMRQVCTLAECYGARLCLAPHSGPDISSTMIKRMAAKGEDLAQWVPEPVARYIEANGLYRGRKTWNKEKLC